MSKEAVPFKVDVAPSKADATFFKAEVAPSKVGVKGDASQADPLSTQASNKEETEKDPVAPSDGHGAFAKMFASSESHDSMASEEANYTDYEDYAVEEDGDDEELNDYSSTDSDNGSAYAFFKRGGEGEKIITEGKAKKERLMKEIEEMEKKSAALEREFPEDDRKPAARPGKGDGTVLRDEDGDVLVEDVHSDEEGMGAMSIDEDDELKEPVPMKEVSPKAPPQPKRHTRDSPFAGKSEEGERVEMLEKWKQWSTAEGKKAKKSLRSDTSDHSDGRSNVSGGMDLEVDVSDKATAAMHRKEDTQRKSPPGRNDHTPPVKEGFTHVTPNVNVSAFAAAISANKKSAKASSVATPSTAASSTTSTSSLTPATVDEDNNQIYKVGRDRPGQVGKKWFLSVGIQSKPGLSGRELLMQGVSQTTEILTAAVQGFEMHPIAPDSPLPTIVSHQLEEGFPVLASILLKYFKTRNKRFNPNNSSFQDESPRPAAKKSPHKFDDDADYSGPSMLYGTILVSGNENISDAIECLSWDLDEMGLRISMKHHQSAESMTQIQIIGVPRVFDSHGTADQILHYLKEIEKKMCLKGKADLDLIDEPLPAIVVTWKHQKKGKNKTSMDKKLSLNNISAYRDNGCFILSIEGAPEDWPRMVPLWNMFWQSGKCRLVLGARTKMIQVFQGGISSCDRHTIQRLRRFHVQYCSVLIDILLPHIVELNHEVK